MENIPLNKIYQHKINFLIGSGASSGLFPTLWLNLKDSEDPEQTETIETLATKLEISGYKHHYTLLFMYYFKKIIEPVCSFKLEYIDVPHPPPCSGEDNCEKCKIIKSRKDVIANYELFLDTLVRILQHKNDFTKRCNVFTTNYDGCIPFVADKLLKKGSLGFVVNDGTNGFFNRTLSARNFNTYICDSGIFGKHSTDIPQLNLINLHGSAFWRKQGETISVNYSNIETGVRIPDTANDLLDELDSILNDSDKTINDVLNIQFEFSDEDDLAFWESYNKLPIVNPTKWKFNETVFEEHYYQMLRLLSYQLEEPNSVLITFGFSFADEHIEKLVKRSLSNPKLQVFVCCFNEKELNAMQKRFGSERNVKLIHFDNECLYFTKFNECVFNGDLLRDSE